MTAMLACKMFAEGHLMFSNQCMLYAVQTCLPCHGEKKESKPCCPILL